jgi:hypothetical protein
MIVLLTNELRLLYKTISVCYVSIYTNNKTVALFELLIDLKIPTHCIYRSVQSRTVTCKYIDT